MPEPVHPIKNEIEANQIHESVFEDISSDGTEFIGFNDIEFDDAPIAHVLDRYFQTLNDGDFQATIQLFEPTGALKAPFESEIVGRDAIANYLEQEAKNLQLIPLKKAIEPLETGEIRCRVGGKVNTPLFSVNVAWNFVLNSAHEIRSVEVKLLAALEDLLNMKNAN